MSIVELGSFSAAAERLNLTQPAVSLQIKQLEERLGVPLIERMDRRAHPTDAGRALLAHAHRVEAAVAEAVAAVGVYAGEAGRVRLGTGATACIYLLPGILRALRAAYPRLEITVSTGNTGAVLKQLEENALDIALVTLPAPGRMFEVTPIRDDALLAIFPAEGPIPPKATPRALARLPLVLYEPGGNARRLIDDWFGRAGLAPRPVMELGNVEAIKEMVAAGLGCAILPALAVPAGGSAALVARPLSPPLRRKLGVVLRRDKKPGPPLRTVYEALIGQAEGESPCR
jgi:DNA-binding transcriptional LysR family regulator